MTTVHTNTLDPRSSYRLLSSLITPRPIAWVSTIGTDGAPNLAPFSFFNGAAGSPPTLMISIGQRQGQPKDTLRNILETGEFVVHIVDETLAEQMNLTAGEYAYEVDEIALAGLATLPSEIVRPCRIASAPAAMECRFTQHLPIQDSTYTLVLGQVVCFHLREGLLRPNGQADPELLRPLGRLGGDEYSRPGEIFKMERPG